MSAKFPRGEQTHSQPSVYSRVMSKGYHLGRIFLSLPHMNNGFFFLLTTKYLILYCEKPEKDFEKILSMLRCDMMTSFKHNNDVTDRPATSVRPTCGCLFFYLSHGLVRVCEMELSRMGKTTEIPIWCARKKHSLAFHDTSSVLQSNGRRQQGSRCLP